jgi:hypothetical protein
VSKSAILATIGGLIVILTIALNLVSESPESPRIKQKNTNILPQQEPKTNINIPNKDDPKNTVISPPSFDIVRVTAEGNTVMAGRAAPNQKISIYDGDNKIGEVTTDHRGEWVFVPPNPLNAGNHKLSLRMKNLDGTIITSAADVLLVVPDKDTNIGDRPSDSPTKPLAIKVNKEENLGIEVLQKPYADDIIPLAIDAVDYNDDGKLNIVGKADPGAIINIYLNNNLLGQEAANKESSWSINLTQQIIPGNHNIRADHIDKNGKVISRVEVVFARSSTLPDIKPGTLIVVETGRSLWRIARKVYGKGLSYTVIYEANKAQIKNPDMIFPGQVFSIPSINP